MLSLHPRGAPLPKKERGKLGEEVSAFRGGLAGRCREFALVRDVADATKYARLDRDDAQIKDASGVQHRVEVITGRDGCPIFARDGSPLATSGVVVVLPDGSRHLLAKLLDGAIAFLRKEMGR